MPKKKVHSGAKKRFKVTANGKVKAAAAGKRHNMRRRSQRFLSEAKGTMVLFKTDGDNLIKHYLQA